MKRKLPWWNDCHLCLTQHETPEDVERHNELVRRGWAELESFVLVGAKSNPLVALILGDKKVSK